MSKRDGFVSYYLLFGTSLALEKMVLSSFFFFFLSIKGRLVLIKEKGTWGSIFGRWHLVLGPICFAFSSKEEKGKENIIGKEYFLYKREILHIIEKL